MHIDVLQNANMHYFNVKTQIGVLSKRQYAFLNNMCFNIKIMHIGVLQNADMLFNIKIMHIGVLQITSMRYFNIKI